MGYIPLGSGVQVNSLTRPIFTTTVTQAGVTNLTVASAGTQEFTGTTTQNVTLPNVVSLVVGWTTTIINKSAGNVIIQTVQPTELLRLTSGQSATVVCRSVAADASPAAWHVTLGLENISSVKSTYNQSSPPTANDDYSQGYEAGSRWHMTDGEVYFCLDANYPPQWVNKGYFYDLYGYNVQIGNKINNCVLIGGSSSTLDISDTTVYIREGFTSNYNTFFDAAFNVHGLNGGDTLSLHGLDNTTIAYIPSGTLSTLAGAEDFTNKTYNGVSITSGGALTLNGNTLTLGSGSAGDVSFYSAFDTNGPIHFIHGVSGNSMTIRAGGNAPDVTLPLSGTLSTLDGAEAFTNKTYNGVSITSGGTLTLSTHTLLVDGNFFTNGPVTIYTATDGSAVTLPASGTLIADTTLVAAMSDMTNMVLVDEFMGGAAPTGTTRSGTSGDLNWTYTSLSVAPTLGALAPDSALATGVFPVASTGIRRYGYIATLGSGSANFQLYSTLNSTFVATWRFRLPNYATQSVVIGFANYGATSAVPPRLRPSNQTIMLRACPVTVAWTANNTVAVGEYRRPTTSNGRRYYASAITSGTTSLTTNLEPTWPTTDGSTVLDAGVTWTADGRAGATTFKYSVCNNSDGPSGTEIDSGVTVDANYHVLKIRYNGSNGWIFSLDGLTETDAQTLALSGGVNPFFGVQTEVAGVGPLYMDRFIMSMKGLASP